MVSKICLHKKTEMLLANNTCLYFSESFSLDFHSVFIKSCCSKPLLLLNPFFVRSYVRDLNARNGFIKCVEKGLVEKTFLKINQERWNISYNFSELFLLWLTLLKKLWKIVEIFTGWFVSDVVSDKPKTIRVKRQKVLICSQHIV